MAYTPILCLDFDGVIHRYTSGWKGASNIPDAPMPGAIQFICDALDGGFSVQIFSSRSKSIFGRWAMKRWLAKALADYWQSGASRVTFAEAECWGDAAKVVNRLKFPWFKPAALLTIDDRAIQFKGEWPAIEDIRAFKPWKMPTP